MARLPNDEWLHLAKGCAVGQEKRVRHKHELSPAMNVGSTADRWWAYCQRCKIGAVEMKSHVMLVDREPPRSRDLTLPHDMKDIQALPKWQQDFLAKFLASKGMDFNYLHGVKWSEERARLMVPTKWVDQGARGVNPVEWMGRDTSGKSGQKWLTYNGQHYVGEPQTTRLALLFEDCFSYQKAAWAVQSDAVTCYCTLGTAIHDSLFLKLLKHHTKVASFYDGDVAGWFGSMKNHTRLHAAGIACDTHGKAQCAPEGKDPKDMSIFDIREHVAKLYGG